MKSLKFTSVVLTLALSQAVGANALYSWKHKDGTPTFSPDPPPKGVPYVIVGPDLKPIPQPLPGLQQGDDQNSGNGNSQSNSSEQSPPVAQQNVPESATSSAATISPTASAAATTNAPVKRGGDIVMTPAPGSADATAPAASAAKSDWKPVMYADDPNPDANTPVEIPPAAEVPASDNQISAECLDVKQQLLTLESKFANAESATEMDNAIVGINSYRKAKKGLCGL